MAQNQRRTELSIMTGFLCCFVVMIHLTSVPIGNLPVGSTIHKLFFASNKALSFVVPAFLFLSGLKLSLSYKNKPFEIGTFFTKRFTKILIPYVFWYVAYYLLFRKLEYMEVKNWQQHIFSFLMGNMVAPFYFITIVFQFYMIFGIILTLFKRFNQKLILIGSVVLEFLYLQYIFIPYEDRFFGTYFIYFILGCYMAFNLDIVKKYLQKYWLIIYAVFLSIMAWHVYHSYLSAYFEIPYAYWRIIACLFSVSAIFAIYHFSWILSQILPNLLLGAFKQLDAASYGVFLCHSYIIYQLNEHWSLMEIWSILRRFVYNTLAVYPIAILGVLGFLFIKKYMINTIFSNKNM